MKAIDLFCGTGGFSRGAHAAGFDVVAAFDIDPNLTSSHHHNFPDVKLHLKDVSELTGDWVRTNVAEEIDLIFGGPPCQGFSAIGRRDTNDPRRDLLGHFFRVVSEVRPAVFVMENVGGLLFDDAKDVLNKALGQVRDYELLEPTIVDAADYGAATKRRRTFVIGYDPKKCAPFDWEEIEPQNSRPVSVREAIADLSNPVKLLDDCDGFDLWRLRKNASGTSIYSHSLHNDDRNFTGNRRTKHLDRVVRRFSEVEQGGFDKIGKYPRLEWSGLCPTIRAGTGADHGSHQAIRPIHPDENRVITVREAARLQGFPDHHRFHPTIWHSFRQIGNSVSPVLAKAILTVLYDKLEHRALARSAA